VSTRLLAHSRLVMLWLRARGCNWRSPRRRWWKSPPTKTSTATVITTATRTRTRCTRSTPGHDQSGLFRIPIAMGSFDFVETAAIAGGVSSQRFTCRGGDGKLTNKIVNQTSGPTRAASTSVPVSRSPEVGAVACRVTFTCGDAGAGALRRRRKPQRGPRLPVQVDER
jgi:hypothetical protein